ncbi:unnamed protein product [Paramecium octaurelia]|uniref:Uncharacterized protein n=1 Tax=Paramecium octaurelia TaxID=43137 RepID=A0A8S1YQJ1_PAROT|nr:unnamed protein product [Paramecium octaurelia]CAD8214332.1 unnamed protein product [Paramecium octaurelia]
MVSNNNKNQKIGKWTIILFCWQIKQRKESWKVGLFYHNNLKKQQINFFFKGRGYYDKNGMKQGKWIEILDGFTFFLRTLNTEELKILNIGEYKNGRKI